MIDHLSSYTTDFVASQRFYDAVLQALGFERNANMSFADDILPAASGLPARPRRACAYGPGSKPTFWVIESREAYTPRHVAFVADSEAAVAAFRRR